MAEFRGIQTSWFLILMLQFREAATATSVLALTVEDGDDVTLPCHFGRKGEVGNCNFTTWSLGASRRTSPVNVFTNGKLVEEAKAESDGWNVSEDCSLVRKKVKGQDAGYYGCSQFIEGHPYQLNIYLSVVTLTKHEDKDEVTLNCSVSMYNGCKHTVKWRLNGGVVTRDKELQTSQSLCATSLSFKTSRFFHTTSFTSLKCEVTDGDKVMQFSLRNSPSEDPKPGNSTTTSTVAEAPPDAQIRWKLTLFCVGLAALIITVVMVNVWARVKERSRQRGEYAVRYDAEDDTVNYENVRPADGV
ncbi:uncharacterized protein AB9W97_003725 isoform 2-T2 [Spinachia spinachia]